MVLPRGGPACGCRQELLKARAGSCSCDGLAAFSSSPFSFPRAWSPLPPGARAGPGRAIVFWWHDAFLFCGLPLVNSTGVAPTGASACQFESLEILFYLLSILSVLVVSSASETFYVLASQDAANVLGGESTGSAGQVPSGSRPCWSRELLV